MKVPSQIADGRRPPLHIGGGTGSARDPEGSAPCGNLSLLTLALSRFLPCGPIGASYMTLWTPPRLAGRIEGSDEGRLGQGVDLPTLRPGAARARPTC
jgi:hypothetical protein